MLAAKTVLATLGKGPLPPRRSPRTKPRSAPRTTATTSRRRATSTRSRPTGLAGSAGMARSRNPVMMARGRDSRATREPDHPLTRAGRARRPRSGADAREASITTASTPSTRSRTSTTLVPRTPKTSEPSRRSRHEHLPHALHGGVRQSVRPVLPGQRVRVGRRRPQAPRDPSNCVHCKTCDIRRPYEIIFWVPPEGGGGPRQTYT